MKDIIIKNYPHILHGADYNPEQWKDCPEILAEDMRLMKLANCNEMTLGMFSWCEIEPEEGKFDFSFLDEMMDRIYAVGGRVILATPSGSKPVWMAKKYPEILLVDKNGNRNEYGSRHNHCNNSPVYREKVRIVNEKLAERYKDHPALIAWHLSNEYGNYYEFMGCFCSYCRAEFQQWLKAKYKTIDQLNHQWWTHFWSHKYSSFEEIDPPSSRTDTIIHGRNLDWRRFISDKYIEFLNIEAEPLRRITPDIPITTNLMDSFTKIDYQKLSDSIDFVSWDNYPRWTDSQKDVDVALKTAFNHDFMRSLKHKPFLLMESTPSLVNWHEYNKLKRPNVHRLSSLQALAHGSDSVQYFQWRKSRGCSEKFHGAVVDHCGHENTRVFGDVSRLGATLKKLDEIVGTVTKSEIAIFHNVENFWALKDSQGFSNVDKKYFETVFSFYKPLWKKGINADIIGKQDHFEAYKVIIAPMLYMIDETLKNKLCDYVRRGGTLICTYMTGYVNENDLCHLGGFPFGELKELFGIWNEEIDTLYPDDSNLVKLENGKEYEAVDYCEIVHLQGALCLGRYERDFYAGNPAVTVNEYGKGKAYYLAFRDKGNFTCDFIGQVIEENGLKSDFDGKLPSGVTAHSRTDGENIYVFLENYNHHSVEIETNRLWVNVENSTQMIGKFTLPPLDTLILKG